VGTTRRTLAREGSPPVSVKQSEGRGKGKSFGECVQRHGSLKNMRHFVRVGRARPILLVQREMLYKILRPIGLGNEYSNAIQIIRNRRS
jgi:hypothetical protein